jgi:hypothetical protein
MAAGPGRRGPRLRCERRLEPAVHLLAGADAPAFAALKAEYADVLRGPPPGLPPDRGHRDGRRAGAAVACGTQLVDLLDRGWMQDSTAGHAASVVFARKRDGS